MARPLRITYPGAFYHITSRGNESKQIFKSLADKEKFLFYLNPMRAKMVDKLQDYRWSSYPDYIGNRKPPAWLERDFILGYFGKKPSIAQKNYREFVDAKLDKKYKSPLREVVGSTILGSADFVDQIKAQFIEGKKANRDLPALKALSSKPVIEDIIKAVESAFTQQPALIKNVSLFLCHRHTGSSLKQIGRHFSIGESAVSQASRRIGMKIIRDKKLKKRIQKVENKLNLSRV